MSVSQLADPTTHYYMNGTGILLGWCTQLHGFTIPSIAVLVKVRGGDAACQSQQLAAVAPGPAAFISS